MCVAYNTHVLENMVLSGFWVGLSVVAHKGRVAYLKTRPKVETWISNIVLHKSHANISNTPEYIKWHQRPVFRQVAGDRKLKYLQSDSETLLQEVCVILEQHLEATYNILTQRGSHCMPVLKCKNWTHKCLKLVTYIWPRFISSH